MLVPTGEENTSSSTPMAIVKSKLGDSEDVESVLGLNASPDHETLAHLVTLRYDQRCHARDANLELANVTGFERRDRHRRVVDQGGFKTDNPPGRLAVMRVQPN